MAACPTTVLNIFLFNLMALLSISIQHIFYIVNLVRRHFSERCFALNFDTPIVVSDASTPRDP